MLKASWTEKKTNESVLKEVDTELNLFDRIRTEEAKFVGDVMRRYFERHPYNWRDEREVDRRNIWNGLGRRTDGGKGIDLILKCEDKAPHDN